jgi:hypothetical protein
MLGIEKQKDSSPEKRAIQPFDLARSRSDQMQEKEKLEQNLNKLKQKIQQYPDLPTIYERSKELNKYKEKMKCEILSEEIKKEFLHKKRDILLTDQRGLKQIKNTKKRRKSLFVHF